MKLDRFVSLVGISLLLLAAPGCGRSPLMPLDESKAVTTREPAVRTATPETSPGANPGSTPGASPEAAACPIAFPKSGLCASLAWDGEIAGDDENSFTLKFWDKTSGSAAGPYKDAPGDVAAMLWMPSMGHGSAPVIVTPQGSGVYLGTRVLFVMPGEWDLRLQIKKNSQLFEQAVLPLKI